MSRHTTLADFDAEMERKHPHLAQVRELREKARSLTGAVLGGLKSARRNARKRQGDVAKAIGVSQSTVSRIESGAEALSLEAMTTYALACDCKIAFILVPKDEDLRSAKTSQDVVEEIITQLYPELALDDILSQRPRADEEQVKHAANTISSGLASLGVALHQYRKAREAVET